MSNSRGKWEELIEEDLLYKQNNTFDKGFFERMTLHTPIPLKKEGVKYSPEKAPMGMLLKQFPLALEAIAKRSKIGHDKYEDFDSDWMNFKRVPNAEEEYLNATVRHLAEIGDDESPLEHLKAAAWNILATLQLKLENG